MCTRSTVDFRHAPKAKTDYSVVENSPDPTTLVMGCEAVVAKVIDQAHGVGSHSCNRYGVVTAAAPAWLLESNNTQ
ncbi:uncharacterized [Tachysurus ichikawai]